MISREKPSPLEITDPELKRRIAQTPLLELLIQEALELRKMAEKYPDSICAGGYLQAAEILESAVNGDSTNPKRSYRNE